MSSKTEYSCDFCQRKVVPCSLNQEYIAYTIKGDSLCSGPATKNLSDSIYDHHICERCLDKINKFREKK